MKILSVLGKGLAYASVPALVVGAFSAEQSYRASLQTVTVGQETHEVSVRGRQVRIGAFDFVGMRDGRLETVTLMPGARGHPPMRLTRNAYPREAAIYNAVF